MSTRTVDVNGDWVWGIGVSAYVTQVNEVCKQIQYNIGSFLGDCFFSTGTGLDWFNLLGSKNQVALNLAITGAILNTPNVTGIIQPVAILNPTTRSFTVQYNVQTVYGPTGSNIFQYDFSV